MDHCCHNNKLENDKPDHQSGAVYTCPMHPEIQQEKPGMCPECGMNLVPAKDKKAASHQHSKTQEHEHEGHGEHHDHSAHHAAMAADFKRRFFIAFAVSIPILALSPSIQNWFGFSIPPFYGEQYVMFGLASIVALYCSWPFYAHAYDELKEKQLGMMVLVSLAVLSGYLYSAATTFFIQAPDFYWEIATLAMVLLLGHWLEMRAVVGTSGALKELVALIPPKANRIKKDGSMEVVETAELAVGDIILIKPGEKVPIDGTITEGESSVNESLITGESTPVHKKAGDAVIGGSLNVDGSLTVKVVKTGAHTALSQIIALVKSAQESKPRSQRLADKAAHWLTIIAITVGVGTFLVWNVWLGTTFVFALTLAITVVVITCPHALGLAIPAVTTITSTLAAKHGILIKNMDGLDAARSIGWVLFDKTGTLTHGTFGVSDIVVFGGEKDALLQYAASVESHSEHTIGRSIAEHAKEQGMALLKVKGFKAIAGQGVFARVQDANGEAAEVVVGTVKLLQDYGIELGREHVHIVSELEHKGATVVYVASRKKLIGVIALSDTVKDESKQAVRDLEAMGMRVAMITGDNEAVAKHVARELGIQKYFSRVLPEDKVKKVQELQSGGKKVMMVGDGVNDAPALTQSDVGVAIGAGTDVAAASSEIILVKSNPLDVVSLIKLSRATSTKMKQNLVWALGYNIVAIPLAAGALGSWGIFLRPEWGAIAMTLSSVIVVINALLLKRLPLGAAASSK